MGGITHDKTVVCAFSGVGGKSLSSGELRRLPQNLVGPPCKSLRTPLDKSGRPPDLWRSPMSVAAATHGGAVFILIPHPRHHAGSLP